MLGFFSPLAVRIKFLSSEPLFWSKIGARLGMWTRSVGFFTWGGARAPPWGGSPFCEREAPAEGAETWLSQKEALSTNSPAAPGAGRELLYTFVKPKLVRASSFLLLHIPWDTLAINTLWLPPVLRQVLPLNQLQEHLCPSPCFPSTPSISTPSPRTLHGWQSWVIVLTLIIPTLLLSPLEGPRDDHCYVFPLVATQSP